MSNVQNFEELVLVTLIFVICIKTGGNFEVILFPPDFYKKRDTLGENGIYFKK